MGAESRAYPIEELESIASRASVMSDEDGFELEVHPVPGDDREHVLDPRVYERARAKLAAAKEAREAGESGADGGEYAASHPDETAAQSGSSIIAFRSAPNKETRTIKGEGVNKGEVRLDLGDHKLVVHVFVPQGHKSGSQLLIYNHGGGFASGNLGQYENDLRYICEAAGCVCLYPEYRLAPETPFPGGLNDCLAVYDWAVAHADELGVDSGRIAVAGDSAGGSLSNAVVQLRGKEGRIKLLVEMYPLVDAGPVPSEWSHDLYPAAEGQEAEAMSRVDRIRLTVDELPAIYTEGDWSKLADPLISAMNAEDVSMFPRTLVVSSEFDYLRWQDELFAKKLHRGGVDVRAIRYGGCDHGFFETCGIMPQAEDLCLVIADEMARM